MFNNDDLMKIFYYLHCFILTEKFEVHYTDSGFLQE